MNAPRPTYPAGTLLRVGQITTRPGGPGQPPRPGLLPINPSTWYAWVKAGRVPQGRRIGPNTVVWPIEEIQALADPATGADAPPAPAPAAPGAPT